MTTSNPPPAVADNYVVIFLHGNKVIKILMAFGFLLCERRDARFKFATITVSRNLKSLKSK